MDTARARRFVVRIAHDSPALLHAWHLHTCLELSDLKSQPRKQREECLDPPTTLEAPCDIHSKAPCDIHLKAPGDIRSKAPLGTQNPL